MTDTWIRDSRYPSELTHVDREALHKAAGRLDDWGSANTPPSVIRYVFYRRRGHGRADSLRFALAYLRNTNEQFERRLSHDTGAEGWRSIGT